MVRMESELTDHVQSSNVPSKTELHPFKSTGLQRCTSTYNSIFTSLSCTEILQSKPIKVSIALLGFDPALGRGLD